MRECFRPELARFGGSAPKAKRGRPKGSVQRVVRVAKAVAATPPAASLQDENQRLKVMLVNLMLERDRLRERLAGR